MSVEERSSPIMARNANSIVEKIWIPGSAGREDRIIPLLEEAAELGIAEGRRKLAEELFKVLEDGKGVMGVSEELLRIHKKEERKK
jgi:hypothetical protein